MAGHPLKPVQRTYVSDAVTELLENYIIDNGMQEGDKLPSERELAGTLKVGTRTIREALQRLETRGLIEVVHGKGSFVANRNIESYARHLVDSFRFLHDDEQKLLEEITHIREIIETAAVGKATNHANSGIVAKLYSVLEALSEAKDRVDVERYNQLDLQFHRLIVQYSDNTLLLALYDNLRGLLERIFAGTGHIAGALDRSFPEHKDIVRSIESGDQERAKRALLKHLAATALDVRAFVEKAKEA